MVLDLFHYDPSALLAGAGIVGLAVGFGAQGLVSDIVTGFFILLEKQLDVGDYITVATFDGIVEQVGLRTTQIRSFDGTLHYIPNRNITNVSNHSRGTMQALVDIKVPAERNLDETIHILQHVCDETAVALPQIKEGPNVIGIQELGTSEIVIRVIAKTENMEQWRVERVLRKEIKPHSIALFLKKQNNKRTEAFASVFTLLNSAFNFAANFFSSHPGSCNDRCLCYCIGNTLHIVV